MRILKLLLPLLVLLLWSTTAKAQYNPTDPPEPGVYFTLTTQAVPSDAAYRLTSSGTRAFGSSVNMSTSPNTGYRFVQWEDEEGTVVSTSQDFTYTMPAKNVTLIARFEYNPTSPSEPSTPEFKDVSYIRFQINPSDAGYMSSGSNGEYEVGTTHRFIVRSNSNYRFVNWTCDGLELGTSTSLDYTVPNGDRTLVANFAYDPTSPAEPSTPNFPRYLNLHTNLDGAGSLTGGGSHAVGSSFTVSASSNTYYHFVNWTDEEGNVVSETSRFTYTMPDRNVTLTANYTYNYDPTSPGEPGTPNPDNGMAENMVLWPRMGMYDDTHVQILCETPGATIHYTLDGSTPNAESPVYTEPVFVGSNLLVRAIAYKEGMEDSPVVSYQVTVYKVATPVYTFENRKIKISSETPDAIIRYTLDFTDPNEESEIYTEPFAPEENCRIKAYASKEGLTDSPINIFVFRRADYTIPAPTFSINETGRLVITSAVDGGEIRYTLDGSDPAETSTLYTEPLALDGNFTVRAFTIHPNYYDSLVGEYVIDGFKVETPTYSYTDLALNLATTTPGATLRYTLDGTIPSAESTVYSVPLRLTEDCKVAVRGFKDHYEPSDTVSYTFVLADHKVSAPVLTYDPEALTVTMVCDTVNAEIRYTIDGEAPTATTGMKYEGPLAVVGNHIYTARAFRTDLFDSEAASVTVDDQKVKTPASSYNAKLLTLSCPDELATIHYTTDGSTPTAASATYSEPLPMSADCTVKFIAVREFFLDSDPAEYVFRIADHQVVAPIMTYDRDALTVSISCATEGAEIRYTIDGEVPTASTGTIYTAPIPVVGNHLYQARAFRADLFDSEPASVTVDDQKVKTPASSYEAKLLTLSCPDELATIHYTTDGSTPTAASATYSEPLPMSADCTVKFIAVRESFLDSDPAEYVFRVADHQVAAPVMTYDRDALTVSISCATEGAEIRYTIDGEVPTATTGTVYTAPIPVVGNHLYRARAFRADLFDSEPASVTVDDQKVKTPASSYDAKLLTLSCPDELATIHYTTDGSTPTAASATYSEPLPMSADCTVKFIAVRESFLDSDPAEYVFRVADHQVAAPVMTYDRDALIVSISCATEGAEIRYTIDGDVPTATTGNVYEGPIAVVGNHVYRARAFRADLFDSELTTLTVDDQKVKTPTANFANKLLTLTCSDPEAQILYTTVPEARAEWTQYTEPIALTENCTVYFYATREYFNDSDQDSYHFLYVEHQVATPTFDFNRDSKQLVISCDTEGAQIRYTIDGDVPTATTGTVYTEPIPVVGNHTFRARAFKDGLFDSEPAVLVVDDQYVMAPTASFANKLLTLSCPETAAIIRYTTDNSDLSEVWTIYEGPIALTEDCTVRYFAHLEGFNDTEGVPFIFVYADHQVNAPRFSYDSTLRQMTITCGTEGAQIRYTTDGSEPTATDGTVYTVPISVEGNMTFKAIATRADLFDSKVAEESVTDQQVPKPTASYAAHQITLQCEDEDAQIRYTLNDTQPTSASTLYQQAIPVEDDCIVRFVAIRSGYRDSEENRFDFSISEYTEVMPGFDCDYRGRRISITQPGNLIMEMSIDGTVDTIAAPATIDVTPGMTRISARTLASNEDMYDSWEVSQDIVFHSVPEVIYDDMSKVNVGPGKNEPHAERIVFHTSFNGVDTEATEIEIDGFGDITSYAESDVAFRSEPAEMRIDHFNTGNEAGAKNGHRLAEAFPKGFDRNSCTSLRVVGETTGEDMLFLASLPRLATLELAPDSFEEEDYDGVLSGSYIETIGSSFYPEGMLKDMPRLTTVIWNGEDEGMPEGRLSEAGNPNILLWVKDLPLASSDAVNVVVDSGNRAEAESISLQVGYPFNAHRPFKAVTAEVVKEFTLPTVIEKSAGWETLTLPFTTDSIVHETAGRIVPYSAWTGKDDPMKPFWLYGASDKAPDGWEADSIMRAGVPYIISMPNNEEYVHGYSLPGKVTFAARDVEFGIKEAFPKTTPWIEGAEFVGTFMPVEEEGVYSLNVKELADEEYLGSAFIPEDETLPFGAYITGSGLPQRIPVFGDWSGVITPVADASGFVVETPAPGMIRVSSSRGIQTAVVTPEGAVIRTISLQTGESLTVEGLTRGLYIVGGVKVMVR